MLFGDTLLRNTLDMQLLVLLELADQNALLHGIPHHGLTKRRVPRVGSDHKLARIDIHRLVRLAVRPELQGHRALVAVILTSAVPGIFELVNVGAVQWNQTKSMRDKLVS